MANPPPATEVRPAPAARGDPDRERRLAEALRANLKRRKQAARTAAAKPAETGE